MSIKLNIVLESKIDSTTDEFNHDIEDIPAVVYKKDDEVHATVVCEMLGKCFSLSEVKLLLDDMQYVSERG